MTPDPAEFDPASLPTSLWRALADDLASFPAHVRERGFAYAAEGRVGMVDFWDHEVAAVVRGKLDYRVKWEWKDGLWIPECTCPAGSYCKHAYALACSMLDRVRGQAGLPESRLARLIPPVVPPPRAIEPELAMDEAPFAFSLSTDDDESEPEPEERAGTPSVPDVEQELLRWAGRRATVPSRRLRVVFSLSGSSRRDVEVTTEVRLTTSRLRDVPRSVEQLRQLRIDLRRKPGFMSEDQAALLEAILDAYETDYTLRFGDGAWRGTSRALVRMLRQLGDSPFVSWSDEISPALARRSGVAPGSRVRMDPEPLRLLPVCVEKDGEASVELRVFWPDGRQRALGQIIYFGARVDFDERHPALVLAEGAFHEVTEQPPAELLSQFRRSGAIAVRREVREPLLATLAAGFPSMRDSLTPHVRFHPAMPAVALELRADDWLQIRVYAHTAGAEWKPGRPIETPGVQFEYTPQGRWERAALAPVVRAERSPLEPVDAEPDGGPAETPADATPPEAGEPPAPDQVWLESPESLRVAPVLHWLASTGARAADPGGAVTFPRAPAEADAGWWIKLGPRSVGALIDAWDQRPRHVQWFGNAQIQRLLGRATTARPRFSVKSWGVDWFAISAEWEAEGARLSDEDLALLQASSTRWVKLPSGWTRREVGEIHERSAQVLADLGIEPGAGEQRVTLWQLAQAPAESLAELEQMGAGPEAIAAIHRIREQVAQFRGLPPCPVPAGFRGELRPYQQQGLDFLAYTSSIGLGAVLADDMGLGKTIQALAWVQHLRELDPASGPCLVVCPTSVMHNWERESARFAPGLRVLALARGGGRHALRREIPRHDLLVTNYALLRRDLAAWKETELGAVILDEAQNIKNPDTAVAHAALELSSKHRLALTGTPLENRALDLWSIMRFINPGYLGSRANFSARYDRLDAPAHARALLAAKLRPVMLRRLKRQVAPDLPERIEERRDCEMTRGQRLLYLDELRKSRELIQMLAVDPEGVKRNKISILAALTRLRQICCHPMLIGGGDALGSGKFDALFELLEPLLAEGHKVLVFSQFVECLKLLAIEMKQRSVGYHLLTGQTTNRPEVVAAFEHDPNACVFLISLRAGGTGLNLTAASYVVLFDPWWNPAVEAQAIDRTHRIGQDRTVIAYRMLTQGSIEEKIWELQQRKGALVHDVLGEDGFARMLDREALEYLLADL